MFQTLRRRWKLTIAGTMVAAFVALGVVAGYRYLKTKSNVEALRRHHVWALSSDEWFRSAEFNTLNVLLFQLKGGSLRYYVEDRCVDDDLATAIKSAPIPSGFDLSNCVIATHEVLANLLDDGNAAINFHACRLDGVEPFDNVFLHCVVRRPTHWRTKAIESRIRELDHGRSVELTFEVSKGVSLPGLLDAKTTVEFGNDWTARKRLTVLTVQRDGQVVRMVGQKSAADQFEGAVHVLWSPMKNVQAQMTLTRAKSR